MNLEQARYFMVEQQIRPWNILDPEVLDLFMDIPRHNFVADAHVELAYSDIELPIGEGQLMLHPKVEGRILQAVEIDAQDTVLEIGTGSGYLTALMASLAKEVTTVEIHASLQKTAQERLKQFGNIHYFVGNGADNWDDDKSYDVIVLTGSVAQVSEAYLTKLNLGGRLFVVHGNAPAMNASVFTRVADWEWKEEILFETDLARLTDGETSVFTF